MNVKEIKRISRHRRIRKKVAGTSQRPRLCVRRSLTNFYAQIVNDVDGKVLFGLSTKAKDVQKKVKAGGNIEAATILGGAFAKKLGQSAILGEILAGILIGPAILGRLYLIQINDPGIFTLAEIGIVFLMFLIGRFMW